MVLGRVRDKNAKKAGKMTFSGRPALPDKFIL
jgi:hypothetical protein